MSGFVDIPFEKLPEVLLPWYALNARPLPWRQTREPYRVWVSEVMLQQTRAAAVEGYYARFLKELPDIAALAAVGDEKLLKLWEGLGYYSRARSLKRAAQQIVEHHGGKFPEKYQDILALPGVGEYTAGAIASICFEQPTPAIDGNVLRISARLGDCGDNIDHIRTKRALGAALAAVYPKGRCGDFTQALMELGATVCLPNGAPLCASCPAALLCLGRARGTAKDLPVRAGKRPRKVEERTALLLTDGRGRVALRRRPPQGLLGGLYELPNTLGKLNEQEALAFGETLGVIPRELTAATAYIHIFTHVEWHMTCYHIRCDVAAGDGLIWADEAQRKGEYALPSAFQKAYRLSACGMA